MKLLKPVAYQISLTVMYIINLSWKTRVCPSEWKIAKNFILPKKNKKSFLGENSRQSSLSPALSNIMKQIMSKLQCVAVECTHTDDGWFDEGHWQLKKKELEMCC